MVVGKVAALVEGGKGEDMVVFVGDRAEDRVEDREGDHVVDMVDAVVDTEVGTVVDTVVDMVGRVDNYTTLDNKVVPAGLVAMVEAAGPQDMAGT